MLTLLSFIVVIGIIIFVHEFGHFAAAKLSGVRVEVFSLGFPPKMFSKKWGETEYQIAWLPLGGFVKMTGMIDESLDDEFDPNDPRAFINQSFIRRCFIITAGVLMNFVLGFLIYFAVIWVIGAGTISGTTISQVGAGTPAEQAGIIAGDRIIEIEGEPVESWEDLIDMVGSNPNVPLNVSWLREDSVISAVITPDARPSINFETGERDSVGQLGVMGTLEREPVSFVEAIQYGGLKVADDIYKSVISIQWLVTGKAKINELTGPLGIAKMSGESAKSGLATFLMFIAFISVSIGFLNILPIPALDGGHLLFMIIEGIIGREIPINIKSYIIWGGLVSLLLLMITVSYFDVIRVFFSNS